MSKALVCLLLASTAVFAEWKSSPAGAAPADVAPAMSTLLDKSGVKLMDGDKAVAEIWFRSALPAGQNSETNVTLTNVTPGTFMGVVHVMQTWSDRRGQQVKPGTYTLRYSLFPPNGNHQGVAPQRDFLLLVSAADDKDPNKVMSFDEVTKLSMKAMGLPHPGVISLWKADPADFTPGLSQLGENDQVYRTKIGTTPVAIIVYGKAEG